MQDPGLGNYILIADYFDHQFFRLLEFLEWIWCFDILQFIKGFQIELKQFIFKKFDFVFRRQKKDEVVKIFLVKLLAVAVADEGEEPIDVGGLQEMVAH